MASVAILGAGIAGLTAAHLLHKQGLSFSIIEASDHAGGKIQTDISEGFLVEHGPNSLQTSTPFLNQVIEDIGLNPHRVLANDKAKKRFVVRNGVPTALPMSPPALLGSSYFSLKTKLGLLKEPFIPAHTGEEESVASFVARRLGSEILDYAVDPFVTGIFAGNPEILSVQHAFPTLANLEATHGSIFKGLFAGKKTNTDEKPVPRQIFSFAKGMQMLPDALTKQFQNRILLKSQVTTLEREDNHWIVRWMAEGKEESLKCDAVINTIPLPALQACGMPQDLKFNDLWTVTYPPVNIFAMGFKREEVDHPLDGFGMLVPHKEPGIRILGTLFTSTVFPNRAPENHVLLSTLVGGARKGEFCTLPQDLQQDLILDDLHKLLGVHANPCFLRQVSWRNAIPQFNLGYGQVMQALDELETTHEGLFFAGNYRTGISVGDAVTSGKEAAEKLIKQLN